MVSNKCCVPGCTKSAASKFGVPQNMMSLWENIIGCPLNRNSRVCANHFKPNDITSTWESGNGSSQISIYLRKPRLKSGVIPINNISDKVNDINQVNETMTMLNEHNYFKVNLKIELSKYLLDNCNFSFVLTAKMNQDKLERFFGIIRQVSGPNDHPSTPTFLQLYRMLTVSSLIKPPKSGNCTIDEVQKPVHKICEFKDLISNESLREEKIKNMKSKLDLIIEDKNWDCEDIFLEHDYTKSSVFECVVYYLGGYLARRLCKKSKCEVCIKNLKNDGNLGMESELVNLKSKGFLTHPSGNLYKILEVLETCFCKHASAGDAFENTYNEFFLHVTSLTFSCSIHKYEMITDIFTIYITMSMRQFTYIENQKLNKINRAKKKLSKLVSS